MILRVSKRLQARLKINKWHVMVMFACMNAANTYFEQLVDAQLVWDQLVR